jgi:hypothetical protein
MARISINQPVDVHSHPPTALRPDGTIQGDEHVHTFNNLIPACEFAVSLAREGHLNITLYAESDGALDLDQAHQIAKIWESGKVALDATDLEF